jgi:hypothetical protein
MRLKSMEEQLTSKNNEIGMYKKYQYDDEYLSQDAQIRDHIEGIEAKLINAAQKEQKEMADAAH